MTPMPEAPPPECQTPPSLRKSPQSPRMGLPSPLTRDTPVEGLLLNQVGTRHGCDNSDGAGVPQLRDPGVSSAGW